MKKMIAMFYLSLLPCTFVCSQAGVNSDCKSNIETIFKAHTLKIRYEAVQFLYQVLSKERLNHYYELINRLPTDFEETMNVGIMSQEEINKYIKRINCTPEEALKEYKDLIRNIKSEKEIYLKCLETELIKDDLSEYAGDNNFLSYNFLPPAQEETVFLLSKITKSEFLKIFKEFIFDCDEEVLPEGSRVYFSLGLNFKIPLLHSDSMQYEKRSLAAIGRYTSEMYGINYTMPEGFIDLKIKEEPFRDKYPIRAYSPVLQSKDENCILMYALILPPYEDSVMTFTYGDCSSCCVNTNYRETAHRNLICMELRDILGINDLDNRNDHISILPVEKAKEWFNADSVFFINSTLAPEKVYKGQYSHCTAMIVNKSNCPMMYFKWFFTEEGKKNEQKYIEKLSKNVWYSKENVINLKERNNKELSWFGRINFSGY
jgi:hypothetical protein